jgi:enoyl-CoA hydratase/carnithine racemase
MELRLRGGFELALSCHHRIALRNTGTVIGLPEVNFGILPGAGGVVRLTLLIGFERALDYLVTGRRVDPEMARRDGLIDDVVEDGGELFAKGRAWIRANASPLQPRDRPRSLGAHQLPPAVRLALLMAPAQLARLGALKSRAARRIAEVAADACFVDFDTALRIETRALVELLVSPEASSLIAEFFAARQRPSIA